MFANSFSTLSKNKNPSPKIIPGENWCGVCGVHVQLTSSVIGKEHENGKRHQKNLKEIKFVELCE